MCWRRCGGFWGEGEFEAVEPGFGGDPLGGKFVGVEEGVGDSLERFRWISLWYGRM